MSKKYDDIINLPRHISKTKPKMKIVDRAAQFLPFAALIRGYSHSSVSKKKQQD